MVHHSALLSQLHQTLKRHSNASSPHGTRHADALQGPVQNDCKPRARSQLIASTYCIDACHLLVLHLCRQLSHHR